MKPSSLPTRALALLGALVFPSPAWSQSPELTAEARGFIAALARADFAGAAAPFDTRMQAALPPAKLQALWASLQAQAGPFRQAAGTRTEQAGEFSVVFVTCEFTHATLDAKVVFNQERRISGLFFVPARTPAPPAPANVTPPKNVVEEALTVGDGEWALPGTLSRPASGPPQAARPAVVLVHGSGPHDRDETVGANKPFRDLAWGLAARGVAVLRYEKRTKVHAAKLAAWPALTVKEESIDDALAAVAGLRTTAGIDGTRIFVLGHSLGGMLAPRIAQADPAIAGLVILAGPARPMEDLLLEQSRYIFSLDGAVSPAGQEKLEEIQRQVDRLKKLTPADAAAAVSVLGAPAAYWLDLRAYSAPAAARELKQPVFVLQGGRDYQVTTVDFEGWREDLASRDRATLRLYPKLNHLFIAGEGRSTPAEYGRPGRVAEEVIDDITAWIRQN
jgi:alpha-beta hydrolase superfamily lysophospholipase